MEMVLLFLWSGDLAALQVSMSLQWREVLDEDDVKYDVW